MEKEPSKTQREYEEHALLETRRSKRFHEGASEAGRILR